jgi:putative oxidoreductase
MQTRHLFQVNHDSSLTSAGLLVLRVFVGVGIFLKHGIGKLTGYSTLVQHFPDPIHVGARASLAYALLADGICSLLLLMGLATRPAALVSLINLTVAFLLVHRADLLSNGHVDLVFMYIGGVLTLLIAGPGRYSADSWIAARNFMKPNELEKERFIEGRRYIAR